MIFYCWSTLLLDIMIWINLNQQRMLLHKMKFFWSTDFWGKFFNFFLSISLCRICPPLYCGPFGHILYKLKTTKHEDASTQMSYYLFKKFLIRFLKYTKLIFYNSKSSPLWKGCSSSFEKIFEFFLVEMTIFNVTNNLPLKLKRIVLKSNLDKTLSRGCLSQ